MKKAGILMIVGSLLLLGFFFFPMWHIQLFAPQYPEGLGLDIYINDLQGSTEFDIMNIDGLNHYVGMKVLPKVHEMWEFTVFPKVIIGMVILGVIIGLLGFLGKVKPYWFLAWLIVLCILGFMGMYDFNAWLVDYGSDLDPNASIKLLDLDGTPMQYNPPLIGHKKLLNFDVDSWPRLAAYLMMIGMGLVLIAYFVGRKAVKTDYLK